MSNQEQPHRINEEEYKKELQNAEKSDDPDVQTTDYSVIDTDTGVIKGVHHGTKDTMPPEQYHGAGTGTGAGVAIGDAKHDYGTTEEDLHELGDPDTTLGTDQNPLNTGRRSDDSVAGAGTDQFMHSGDKRASADTEE